MTTMISELYEALINAGATEEKAREAAVALACMDAGGRAASGTKAGTAENLATKKDIDEVRGHNSQAGVEYGGIKMDGRCHAYGCGGHYCQDILCRLILPGRACEGRHAGGTQRLNCYLLSRQRRRPQT